MSSALALADLTLEDQDIIERLAGARTYFYDGPGVILPSGRKYSGEEMRALVAEAGFNPLTRDGDKVKGWDW